jgi:serum/glucocorticoid-regulated kinase 2
VLLTPPLIHTTETKEAPPASPIPPSTPGSASGAQTPTQAHHHHHQQQNMPLQQHKAVSPGVLTIGVIGAKDLTLPEGASLPMAIQQALATRQMAASHGGRGGVRESMQRKQMWWLPYIVLEFDKNEIMVDALGGELNSPAWHYKARL